MSFCPEPLGPTHILHMGCYGVIFHEVLLGSTSAGTANVKGKRGLFPIWGGLSPIDFCYLCYKDRRVTSEQGARMRVQAKVLTERRRGRHSTTHPLLQTHCCCSLVLPWFELTRKNSGRSEEAGTNCRARAGATRAGRLKGTRLALQRSTL